MVLGLDRRLVDVVELGETLDQVRVAFGLHAALIGPLAARRTLAVARVDSLTRMNE
jgi:hypothetical protein